MFKKITACVLSLLLFTFSSVNFNAFADSESASDSVLEVSYNPSPKSLESTESDAVCSAVTEISWNQSFDSLESMESESDLIIIGEVVDCVPELRHNLVFTKMYVKINKQAKGDVDEGQLIPILQTGGVYGDIVTHASMEAPLLEKGKTYELYLTLSEKTEKYEEYYLIAGGYQGVFEISGENRFPLSESNTLLK